MRSAFVLFCAALALALSPCISTTALASDTARGADACGIFVATTGADVAGCGLLPESPCASINFGISRAVNENLTCVFVQAGIYNEVVNLVSGVHIQGGYNFRWQFDDYTVPAHAARIRGGLEGGANQYMTVRAVGLTQPTQLSNLIIEGPNVPAGAFSKSSYAVYASNSQRIALSNVQVEAANGAPGAPGGNGSDAPAAPISFPGQDGLSIGCDAITRGQGGPGAVASCGGVTISGAGGQGGTADTSCPFGTSATSGWDGLPAPTGASGGLGGPPCGPGGPGSSGAAGNNGGAGPPGSGGILAGGFWVSGAAGAGGQGTPGLGGGGGGGAGGCDSGGNFYGAGGGGGGAGGCFGTGGFGGGGAGGSFGVFAVNSTAQLANVIIVRGIGGTGGAGGIGGRASTGGIGGLGGQTGSGAFAGSGGNGGNGGHGGGGGGGAGGPSMGIHCSNSVIVQANVAIMGGAGGNGGAGGISAPGGHLPAGIPGVPGTPGVLVTVNGCSTGSVVNINPCDASPCLGGEPCPADLNGDGAVDVFDLLILLGAWGACP
jgi:hypothetical protein